MFVMFDEWNEQRKKRGNGPIILFVHIYTIQWLQTKILCLLTTDFPSEFHPLAAMNSMQTCSSEMSVSHRGCTLNGVEE